MLDKNSVDWLDFHPTSGSGSAGEYRGVPNSIFSVSDATLGAYHPGKTNSTSNLVSSGPLKIVVHSATNNGKFECLWAFYPRYATMTMTKAEFDYWWLYEGVPGGTMDPSQDFMYRSDGTKQFLDVAYTGTLSSPEWVYIGDKSGSRSIYLMHHEADAKPDCYYNMNSEMTVFGFGRDGTALNGYLDATKNQTFSMGFVEGSDFTKCADSINAVYKSITVAVGSADQAVLAPPTLLSPADNATEVASPVSFLWRAAEGATLYHLQVATSNTFASGLVKNDSTLTDTSATVSGLDGRITYFWRVRTKNASGAGDFSAARQFATALGSPQLSSPANASTSQPIPLSLRWKRVTSAASYRVQVATDSSFGGTLAVDEPSVMDTTLAVSALQAKTTYYWHVRAQDLFGSGGYSAPWKFTTALASPVLLSPANAAGDQPLDVTLKWRKVSGASSYRLQVSTESGFGSGLIVNEGSIGDTVRLVSGLLKNTLYYWRVSAVDPGGDGPFSSSWSFTTYLPPPVLRAPSNGALAQPTAMTFRWGPAEGAVRYRFQLSLDSLFSTFIKNDTTETDTTRTVIGLTGATVYFWRVQGITNVRQDSVHRYVEIPDNRRTPWYCHASHTCRRSSDTAQFGEVQLETNIASRNTILV